MWFYFHILPSVVAEYIHPFMAAVDPSPDMYFQEDS